MVLAVALWFVLSFLGLLLPIFVGLFVFLVIAPIASGYVVGSAKRLTLIAILSLMTTVLAGVVGWATIGSVPVEQRRDVLGIGWSSDTLILTWIVLNAMLSFTTAYLKLRLRKSE